MSAVAGALPRIRAFLNPNFCAHPAGSSADGYAKSMCVAAFAAGFRPAVVNYRYAAQHHVGCY